MSQGWISLHRKITEHPFYTEKRKFSRFEAWIDLLLMANYKDNRFLLGNELIECKRGQLVTSIRKLGDRWEWSNKKVMSFLKLLQDDQMITYKSTTKRTVVTIEKYDLYQDQGNTKETQREHEGNAKETQRHTNNKDNKENNENKIIMTPYEAEYISELEKLEGYPLDREKDLKYMKELEKRYPNLDLVEAIKKFSVWVMDNPFKKNANHRSQINTSFSKYIEWGTCLKREQKEEPEKKGPLKLVFRDLLG